MPKPAEDPVLRSSRREAIVIMTLWLIVMIYSVTYCYMFGYNQPAESLSFVLGFPSWVFWGILVPWFICCLLAGWLAFAFIRDGDLGQDPAAAERDAELNDA